MTHPFERPQLLLPCRAVFVTIPIALSDLAKALVSGGAGAVGAALIAGGFGLYRIAAGRKESERDRRRDLYSEAYRAALHWCEGIYRIRRRAADGSEDRELVKHFHDMQERIAYFEGWLSMESPEMGSAYRALIRSVRSECMPLAQEAWASPGRQPTLSTPDDDKHPDVTAAKEAFVRDAREHLSRRWWKRRAVKSRYRKEK
jgi:hypothetical protein